MDFAFWIFSILCLKMVLFIFKAVGNVLVVEAANLPLDAHPGYLTALHCNWYILMSSVWCMTETARSVVMCLSTEPYLIWQKKASDLQLTKIAHFTPLASVYSNCSLICVEQKTMETSDFFQLTGLNSLGQIAWVVSQVAMPTLVQQQKKTPMVAGILGSVATSGVLQSAAGGQKPLP